MPDRVVCVGLTTLDLVQQVPKLPERNEKIVADDLWYDVGGPAANAARVARALGCEVALVTALGDSDLAALASARLDGIEIVDIAAGDHRFPVSTVLVTPDGSRSIVSRNAASLGNARLPDPTVARGAEVILHDGHLIDASVALAGISSPIQVLDGGSWKPGLQMLLPRLDIAVVSADFALPGHRPDDVLADLAGFGIPRLARTRGAEPVDIVIGDRTSTIAVPQVPVVDTTGAGDVLHGALVALLAQGRDFTAAMGEAVRIASASVSGRGVLAGLRNGVTQPQQ